MLASAWSVISLLMSFSAGFVCSGACNCRQRRMRCCYMHEFATRYISQHIRVCGVWHIGSFVRFTAADLCVALSKIARCQCNIIRHPPAVTRFKYRFLVCLACRDPGDCFFCCYQLIPERNAHTVVSTSPPAATCSMTTSATVTHITT